ncbi:hypothetical protein [Pseudonocardia sp. N23]|uniref:hypothetical protein n=1 Tax=Pseudonocardia sp. N23 TaxID=1987376 RepID=UPI001559DB44|nr:hypothetical protein [Pseudonocardia sp. N23]
MATPGPGAAGTTDRRGEVGFAAVACLVAAVASVPHGGKRHRTPPDPAPPPAARTGV